MRFVPSFIDSIIINDNSFLSILYPIVTCMKKSLFLIIFLCSLSSLQAQQFNGLYGSNYATVNLVPFNPAYAVKSYKGLEVNLVSGSFMAGTNAYSFSKDYFSDGTHAGAIENTDYFKNYKNHKKYLWGNMDILGPAVSFTLKNNVHMAVYTRVRQITRGGNVDYNAFRTLGQVDTFVKYPDTMHFENAGFSSHAFGEFALSFGKQISTDPNHITSIGVTIKYVKGIAAASIFTSSTDLVKHTGDSTNLYKGDLSAFYSKGATAYVDDDPSNDLDLLSGGLGKGGLGLDIGFQYEYCPDAMEYHPAPYTFKLAASITDIGSIAYSADTGSGVYDIAIKNKADWQFSRSNGEDFAHYFGRLKEDTLLTKKDSSKVFRMGLPTAFRLYIDWNVTSNFWLGASLVLNMRGDNGNIYRPAYVNSLNLTPRWEKGQFAVGIPFSFWGYQTASVGIVFRAGPLFVGSTSIFSTLVAKEIRNLDAYAGLSFKLPKKDSGYSRY